MIRWRQRLQNVQFAPKKRNILDVEEWSGHTLIQKFDHPSKIEGLTFGHKLAIAPEIKTYCGNAHPATLVYFGPQNLIRP